MAKSPYLGMSEVIIRTWREIATSGRRGDMGPSMVTAMDQPGPIAAPLRAV
jgi:hypothetical protein